MESGRSADVEQLFVAAAPGDAIDEMALLQHVRSSLGLTTTGGVRIGRYELGPRLGAGGGGRVYAATDLELKREVALKLVAASGDDPSRAPANRRLLREARAAASVVHPNVVTVFDAGRYSVEEARGVGVETDEPGVFIVMERIDGVDLAEWLRESSRPLADVLRVFTDAGTGLAAAHAAGLVHRDFKPGNVLLGRDGSVKVTDFGLARPSRSYQDSSRSGNAPNPSIEEAVTQPGATAGTPSYMSPEQHRTQQLDARSDQFSFCVSLYEALYGARPYKGNLNMLAIGKQLGELQLPTGRNVPRRVEDVLRRGLSARPEDRFRTMNALLAAIAPPRRRRLLVAGVAITVLGGGALASALAPERERCEPPESFWNADASEAVRAAFVATGRAHAEGSAAAVDFKLSRHATAWAEAWRAACNELPAESTQRDAALACLGERRAHVRELVAVMSNATGREVDRAAAAVSGLRSPDSCGDQAVPEAPPSQRAEVRAVRELIARARASYSIGKYEEADSLSAHAQERAVALEFAPVVAEAAFARALAHKARGRIADAQAALAEAFWTARAAKHDEVALQAASEREFVEASLALDFEAAREWDRHVQAMLATDPPLSAKTIASALNAGGALSIAVGDYDAARERFSTARDRLLEGAPDDEVRIATTEQNIGIAERYRGDYDAAIRWLGAAQERQERILGLGHPARAELLLNVSTVHRAAGRLDEARAALRTALEVFPDDHPDVALAEVNLANVVEDQLSALRLYRSASERFEAALGPDAPRVVSLRARIGAVLEKMGNTAEAIAEYEMVTTAVPPAGTAHTPSRKAYAYGLLALARLYAAEGRTLQSRDALNRFRDFAPELPKGDAAGMLEDAKAIEEGFPE